MTRHHHSISICRLVSGALLACAAALATGCEAPDDEQVGVVDSELRAQLEDLAVRTQELEDREAIRIAVACYGRGHDEIFNHLQGDQSASLAILRECFTDDVQTEVFFFDSPEPMAVLPSLEALVGFIEQFAVDTGYTSARNVIGDIHIAFTGADAATVLSATATPHFIQPTGAPGVEPTVDLVTARYVDEMVRGDDGVWRSRKKALLLDEFWRGTGSFPFAAP